MKVFCSKKKYVLLRNRDKVFENSVLPVQRLIHTWLWVRYKQQLRHQVELHLCECASNLDRETKNSLFSVL